MATEGQNNNVDIQAQDLKSLDLNDIKKLFDKIPKEYLDTLDIDKDGDFDEQDIQKLISGEIDPNSILGKEIKAKQEALSIKLLKEIVDNIEHRIIKRKGQVQYSQKINESSNFTLTNSKKKTSNIKDNKFNKIGLEEKKPKIEEISNNIYSKNENINKLKEELKGNNGLLEQLDTQINVINELINFINKNTDTLTDKDYDFLFENINNAINKSIKLISKINQTFDKISNEEKEKEKLIKKYENSIINLQNNIFKLAGKVENDIQQENTLKNKKLFYLKMLHKLKDVSSTIKNYSIKKAKSKIIEKANTTEEKIILALKKARKKIKETTIGIEESINIKKAIDEKYKLLPNNTEVSNLKYKADQIQNSNKYDKKTKNEELKNISDKISKVIQGEILINARLDYDKTISIFPDNDGDIKKYLNSILQFGKAIEDHNGISSEELRQLKEMGKFLGELKSKALEIENMYAKTARSGEELKKLKEKGKPLLEKLVRKIFSGENVKEIDLKEFENFIKDNTDTNFLNKNIEDMDANDAEKALHYLNSKYNEDKSSWGFDFSDESSINELKDKKDINVFQERLIEKIINEKGGEIDRDAGYGFTNDGYLWGFNKEKGGNYLISISDEMREIQNKDTKEFNSKEFASFLLFINKFSDNKEGIIDTLKYTLGIKKLKQLQELWSSPNFPHTAKKIIEKVNLNTVIKLIETFEPKKFNIELNTKVESEEKLKDKLKTIEEKINSIQDKSTKKEAISLALKSLKIENPKIFDNIDFTKIKNFTQNPDIIGIYKKVIWGPTEKTRKKERGEELKKAKNNFKKALQKMFGKDFNGLQPIYQIIDNTNITAENGNKQAEVMYKIIKTKIQEHNKLHPNNKININEEQINKILEIVNKIRLHNLENKETEFLELIKSLNLQIESLTKEKQKIEEEKIKVTENIEENNKQIKILEEKLKTITDNEEKRKLEKQIKILKEKNKELIKKKEEFEKQITLKNSEIESFTSQLFKAGADATEYAALKGAAGLEQVALEIAQKYKISIKEARKTDEYKKKKIEIEKRTKKEKEKIQAIQSAKTPEERNAIIEDLIKENQEELMKSDYKKDIEKLNNSIKQLSNTTENNKIETYSNNLDITSFSSKGENNYTIKVNGEELTGLTQDEINDIGIKKDEKGNIIIENKEALKNLINMKETLESIGLDFAWKYRNELIGIMKSTHGFMGMEMNLKDDLINKTELNNYLKFIISLIGLQPDLTLNGNKNILRTYNGYSETNKNKNALKGGLGKVGEKFIDMGFLTTDGTLKTNWQANINYYISNNLNKKNEGNTTK